MKPLEAVPLSVLDLGASEATAACARVLEQLGATVYRGPSCPPATRVDLVIVDATSSIEICRAAHAGTGTSGSSVLRITALGEAAARSGPPSLLGDIGLDEGVPAALAGAHAAVAALAAIRWSKRHRRPATIGVAVAEVLAACLGDELPRVVCPRAAVGAPGAWADTPGSSLRVHRCADGFVGIAAPTALHRQYLAAMVGAPRDTPDDVDAAVARWAAQRTRTEAFEEAQLWRIPAAPVLGAPELRLGPHSAARAAWLVDSASGRWVPPPPFAIEERAPGPAGARPQPKPFPEGEWVTGTAPIMPEEKIASPPGRGRPSEARTGEGMPRPPAVDTVGGCSSRRTTTASGEGVPRPPAIDPEVTDCPLSGLTVLDVGQVWAGPHCGRLLAGLGARVVKVEAPRRPDGPRPPLGWEGCWGAFTDLNAGKESLAIDLASPAGCEAFLRLVANADALIENFSPRVMPNFGLGPSALGAANPKLVSLSMPAFGSSGPWANAVSYGSGLELASGLWDMDVDGLPAPAPVPYLDYLAGAYGAAAILAGLLARDATHRGLHVEVTQREVAFQLLRDGRPPRQRGPALRFDAGLLAGHAALDHEFHPAGARRTGGACVHFTRLPWHMYDVPLPAASATPELGQHSAWVLRSLGRFDLRTITHLVEQGVVLDASSQARPRNT